MHTYHIHSYPWRSSQKKKQHHNPPANESMKSPALLLLPLAMKLLNQETNEESPSLDEVVAKLGLLAQELLFLLVRSLPKVESQGSYLVKSSCLLTYPYDKLGTHLVRCVETKHVPFRY